MQGGLFGVIPDFQESVSQYLPFLQNALSYPSQNIMEDFWSLWYNTRAQGTLLDLHGHLSGPLNGPCEADFRGPLLKKGPPLSFHGPNWSFFSWTF